MEGQKNRREKDIKEGALRSAFIGHPRRTSCILA
jgi:hypothetical protein